MQKIFRAGLLAATVLCPAQVMAQAAGEQVASADDGNRIIVTARKREEDIQTVPTTVAVATADTIDRLGLDNLQDIAKTTPGLVFDETFGRDSNRPVIRGQANILGQSGVAFFIDGIYYTGSIADYDVDTIERVEVVKGPQSALYGRNTYSGAINIISKMPGDVWEGRAQVDLGENERFEVTAGIRGPISDGLSLGVNGRFYNFDGEFTNAFDGQKVGKQSSWSASGMLNWDNGGPFTATARVYYNRTDDGQPAIFAQGTDANNCFFDNGSLYGGGGRYFCGVIEPGVVNTDYTRQFASSDLDMIGLEADTYNASLRMEYELSDDLRLVSLTGYNDRTQTTLTDGDYSPDSFQTAVFARFPFSGFPVPPFNYAFVGTTVDFTFANRAETSDWSQELRLEYLGDDFDFILGGYYFDQSDDSFSIRNVPANAASRAGASFGAAFANEQTICGFNPICGSVTPFFGPSVPNDRAENLLDIRNTALFGAATWHITDTINLGFEGRYSEEKIDQVVFDFAEGDMRPAPVTASAKFTKFTPRITFDWQATPDNLFYAIYAQGQKPGGFNSAEAIEASLADPNIDIAAFAEEENKSYEIGFKNVFADGDIIFNIAGFYTDIEGYQLTQNVSVPPNQVSVVVNAGDAVIRGIEVDTLIRLNELFTFTANYALADSEFTSGVDQNQGVLNDVADNGLVDCSIGDQFPGGDACDDSLFGSIDGKRIPRAPVHRFFADLDFRTGLSGDWDIFAGGNVTYTSTSFAQVHNLAETGESTVVDVRLGVESDDLRVQFYVKNLFDEDAIAQIIRYADANASFRRSFIGGLRPGRRIGVILSAGF